MDTDIVLSGAISIHHGHIYGRFLDFAEQPTCFMTGRNQVPSKQCWLLDNL